MSEIRDVQDVTVAYARETGWLARKVKYEGRNGAPDYWFVRRGIWIIMEFKDLGEEPRVHQMREIKKLRAHGAKVYVIDNFEDARDILDAH